MLDHCGVYSKFLTALQCSRIIQMQYYIASKTVGYIGGALKSFITEGEGGCVGFFIFLHK